MAWYKTGTISVTNGSTTVTGSGTQWIANAAIGEALYAPDGRLYEITNIASDTSMTIAPAYLGSTQSGQDYVIVPSQSYIRDLAAQAADLVNNYSTIANTTGVGKFGDGTVSEPGIRFSDDLDTGFYRSGTNEVTFVAGGVAQFKFNSVDGLVLTGDLDVDTLKIDGTEVTATAAELNVLDGITASTAELNILDGVTATAAELNILDGVTATAGEINLLDGVTATTAEINYLDGVTSSIQDQLDSKLDIQALVGTFTWNTLTSSPDSVNGRSQVVVGVHDKMRGCVLNADGTVNYYLNPVDWSEKDDGTASDLTGTDGNVMVEIPKFYYRVVYAGSLVTWEISATAQSGFVVHPAFIKDGVEVDFRYYGAYDACVFDDSATAYISGLNYDNNDDANGVGVDVTASTGDKLASVKGIYPMVGLTRAEFRALAANVGTGWRQLDFALWSAVQMLYLIEYQSFYSQDILGAGNTNGSYSGSSDDQDDSPHTIAGAGDSLGSGSTNTTTGAGVDAKPGTSFMKYRGIENFYGNCWNWADGINVNVGATGNVHVTNTRADFADNVSTNMELVTDSLTTGSNYISALLPADPYFLASAVSGSSSTYITDRHYGSASSDRVVLVGGDASGGAVAGAFCLASNNGSSSPC